MGGVADSVRIGIYYEHLRHEGGYPSDFRALADHLEGEGVEVVRYYGASHAARARSIRRLSRNVDKVDLLHLVGLYLPHNFRVAYAARRGRVPVVCSPLSQNVPDLLKSGRRVAKAVFYASYRRWIMARSIGIHCFSDWEASQLGGDMPPHFNASLGVPDPGTLAVTRSEIDAPFVFFGRNDVYQKGLDILLRAFSLALPSLGSHGRLRIAGRDYEGSTERLNELARELCINHAVELMGETRDLTPIATARFFVYPSRFDGPPRPIRAALSLGVPIVTTEATNMADGLREYGAGFVAKVSPEALAHELVRAARCDDQAVSAMRENAHRLAQRWSWPNVARDYATGYRQVLGV